MKKLKIILLFILIGLVIYICYSKTHTEKNEVINQNVSNNASSSTNPDISSVIDEKLLDESVKKSIIEQVAKKSFDNASGTYAEGHKILKFESKENKIYTYVVAEFGLYELNNKNVEAVSARACPLTFIFDTNYNFEKVLIPDDQNVDFDASVKDILFPENLINVAKVDYSTEFYQKQIESYLIKNSTTNNNGTTTTNNSNTAANNNAKIYIGTTTNFKSFDVNVDTLLDVKNQAEFLIKEISKAIGYDIKVNDIYSGKGGMTIDLMEDSAPFNTTNTYIRK